MIVSVNHGIGYEHAVKCSSNWVPLIDIESSLTLNDYVNAVIKLSSLGYRVIVSDSEELRYEFKRKSISYIHVFKGNDNETITILPGEEYYALSPSEYLKDLHLRDSRI